MFKYSFKNNYYATLQLTHHSKNEPSFLIFFIFIANQCMFEMIVKNSFDPGDRVM